MGRKNGNDGPMKKLIGRKIIFYLDNKVKLNEIEWSLISFCFIVLVALFNEWLIIS